MTTDEIMALADSLIVATRRSLSRVEIDSARLALLTAVEAAIASQGEQASKCQHNIADARNEFVRSGYVCVKCGALFSAAGEQAKPLTDGEVDSIVQKHMGEINLPEGNALRKLNAYRSLVRSGEAAHNFKEQA